jgi:hypothetical protein
VAGMRLFSRSKRRVSRWFFSSLLQNVFEHAASMNSRFQTFLHCIQCGSFVVDRQYVWTHERHVSNSQKRQSTFLRVPVLNFSQQMEQVVDILSEMKKWESLSKLELSWDTDFLL